MSPRKPHSSAEKGSGTRKVPVRKANTLLEFLLAIGYKRTRAKQLLKFRSVAVNDKTVSNHDHPLHAGDTVIIGTEKRPLAPSTPSHGLKIVFEDEHIIVIEKPAGLLTISTEKEKTKTAYFQLNRFLKERNPKGRERIFIVHRLDRDTSGLILFARKEAVKKSLQENWKSVIKKYYAIVEGTPRKRSDVIAAHLKESKSMKVHKSTEIDDARYAATKYEVRKAGDGYALLNIDLLTGRKNQIRVHLADIGHPVAGDRKYGAKSDPLRRLALHAYLLSFPHPVTGKNLQFKTPVPNIFGKLTRFMK